MRGKLTRGVEIRQWREAAGLTQQDLSEAADLDVKTIRKAEAIDGRIDWRVVVAISTALGREPSDLIVSEPTECPTPERLIELVRKWQDAMMQADIPQLLSLHTPDTVVELPGALDLPGGQTVVGLEELDRMLQYLLSILRLRHVVPESLQFHVSENFVFMRSVADIEYLPIGKSYRARHINEFEFEGELVKKRVTIADYEPFRQLLAEAGHLNPLEPRE